MAFEVGDEFENFLARQIFFGKLVETRDDGRAQSATGAEAARDGNVAFNSDFEEKWFCSGAGEKMRCGFGDHFRMRNAFCGAAKCDAVIEIHRQAQCIEARAEV